MKVRKIFSFNKGWDITINKFKDFYLIKYSINNININI